MPNELTIQPIGPVPGSADTSNEPKAEHFPVPQETQPTTHQPYANPSLRLDAALGLVVIEFRNDAGSVTSSIPSERQLQAYRMHQEQPPGDNVPKDPAE
jgi:hypothetical protein